MHILFYLLLPLLTHLILILIYESIKMSIMSVRTLTIQYFTVSMWTELLSFVHFFFSILTSSKLYDTRETSVVQSGFNKILEH